MFEEKKEEEEVFFPENPAEFKAMLSQLRAEGALAD